jgi:hypothetical protein
LKENSVKHVHQTCVNQYLQEKLLGRDINREWEDLRGEGLEKSYERYRNRDLGVWNDDIGKMIK